MKKLEHFLQGLMDYVLKYVASNNTMRIYHEYVFLAISECTKKRSLSIAFQINLCYTTSYINLFKNSALRTFKVYHSIITHHYYGSVEMEVLLRDVTKKQR